MSFISVFFQSVFSVLALGLALSAVVTEGHAAPQHGIAMLGTPKYKRGFTHFDYHNADAPKGGDIVLGEVGTFDSLHPFNIKGSAPRPFWSGEKFYFETLMARSADEPFSLYGYIAETIEVAPDFSWVEFKLNPKAVWHDKTPITTDDVEFSWSFFKDHGRINQRIFYSQVDRVEKKDLRTIRFYLKKKGEVYDRELPMIFALMTIISAKEANNPALKQVSSTPLMGSGPYKIKSVDMGRSITFERLPDHWAKDLPVLKGIHNFDTVRFDYYRDAQVLKEAFKAGQFHFLVETDPNAWCVSYDFPAVTRGDVVKREMDISRAIGQRLVMFNTRRPLFQDRQTRKALCLLYDGQAVNKFVYKGLMARQRSFYDPTYLGAYKPLSADEQKILEPFRSNLVPEIFQEAFLPEDDLDFNDRLGKAMTLLEKAGWTMNKGVMSRDGIPLRFSVLLKDKEEEKLLSHYVQTLAVLGIKVDLLLVEKAQYETRLRTFDFDMVICSYGQSLSPGNEQEVYWSSKAAKTEGSRNYAGIQDPVVDELCRRIPTADTYELLTQYVHCLDIVLKSGYYGIPLFYPHKELVIMWDRFGMPPINPKVGFDFRKMWIKDKR